MVFINKGNIYLTAVITLQDIFIPENFGRVKPLTTKVASFPSPFRGRDCLSEIQRCPQYPAAYTASTAARLIRSDKVQVLLFRHRGTFAPMSCCTVTGTDFKISRMKYREPIL